MANHFSCTLFQARGNALLSDLQTEEGALSQLTQQLGTNTTQGNSSVTCNIHKQQDHLFRCMLTCSIPPSAAVPCMLATATHAASYVA